PGAPHPSMAELTQDEQAFLDRLGRAVRAARAVRGMSRRLLAQASGLSERYIAQLESGRGNVSILLLRRISDAMGGKLEDLIASDGQPADWPVLRELVAGAAPERI